MISEKSVGQIVTTKADRARTVPEPGRRHVVGRALTYFILILGATICLLPLIWAFSASLKKPFEVFSYPPTLIPRPAHWENYAYIFQSFPLVRSFQNTMIIVILSEIAMVFGSAITAFAFARLHFPGRDALFFLVLSTMMLPGIVQLIPQFILFRTLGWIDTFKPLVVPAFFGGGAFFIFLLRQFMRTIPTELDDAARIDGCGVWGLFRHIAMPLSAPALGTVAIFTFMGSWSDFMGPLIYLNTRSKQTLAIAIRVWQELDRSGVRTGSATIVHLLGLSLILMIPPMLLFFFAQRQFIQGVVFSGIKG